MTRNLKSVADFADASPFSQPQVRWWIHRAGENGLAKAKAIIRIGRRVYIDVDAFERWLESQQEQQA